MALSEPLLQAVLSPADMAGCLALSAGAGWNQTADDWRLFMAHGQVIGCRGDDGEIVATAASLPYAGRLGWISMVLVAPAWRQRGLATRLLESCVQQLQGQDVVPVLDATPAGLLVYRGLGFQAGFELERWETEAAVESMPALPAGTGVRRVDSGDDAARVALLDRQATGLQRRFLLDGVLARDGSRGWLSDDDQGFVLLRSGMRASQIGPLVAPDEAAAIALLSAALADVQGPVFLDVPTRWAGLSDWLAAHGFRRQRPFVRMALASAVIPPIAAAHDHLFVIAGPEFG